jgi:hypothetical protein
MIGVFARNRCNVYFTFCPTPLSLPLELRVHSAQGNNDNMKNTSRRDSAMGRISVDMQIANNDDLAHSDTFTGVVKPKRASALIGAVVLEVLDLLVDCRHQRLMPRHPDGPLYEIE